MLRPLVARRLPGLARGARAATPTGCSKWEPQRIAGQPDPTEDREAFAVRCSARQRERQLGTGYGFGIFVDGALRRRDQPATRAAGPVPERLRRLLDRRGAGRATATCPRRWCVLARFAFEELHLHRIQIAIIPRNRASRRVVEKLELREEGIAERYLEINGVWEDHVRYAITVEEWKERRAELERGLAGDVGQAGGIGGILTSAVVGTGEAEDLRHVGLRVVVGEVGAGSGQDPVRRSPEAAQRIAAGGGSRVVDAVRGP